MLKIEFTNARVKDSGYGLSVNGKDLASIISTALGTKVDNNTSYNSKLPSFESNCCNVVVTIDPQPMRETVETADELWYSVEDLEECKREQYNKKTKEAES